MASRRLPAFRGNDNVLLTPPSSLYFCYTGPVFEARYYERLEDKKVRCRLCPQDCLIHPGRVGICYVRYNDDGRLIPLTYGRVASVHLDPIEKKPLHFFHPGSTVLSIGAIGCNLGCPWCQNWQIAQPKELVKRGLVPTADPRAVVEELTGPLGVKELADLAERYSAQRNIGVAFTYNEPFIWFEYVLDAAREIRARGLKNVLVTNGFVHEEPLKELIPYIDAMNIDVKGFSEEFYRRVGGSLAPVLKTAESAKDVCHVEITNLLIPGLNTDREQIEALVDWIADRLGPDTPLHFSRYFPARRLKVPSTPAADLQTAQEIAGRRLKAVILGNV